MSIDDCNHVVPPVRVAGANNSIQRGTVRSLIDNVISQLASHPSKKALCSLDESVWLGVGGN